MTRGVQRSVKRVTSDLAEALCIQLQRYTRQTLRESRALDQLLPNEPSLAAGQGLEPRLPGSEPGVLPIRRARKMGEACGPGEPGLRRTKQIPGRFQTPLSRGGPALSAAAEAEVAPGKEVRVPHRPPKGSLTREDDTAHLFYNPSFAPSVSPRAGGSTLRVSRRLRSPASVQGTRRPRRVRSNAGSGLVRAPKRTLISLARLAGSCPLLGQIQTPTRPDSRVLGEGLSSYR